VKERDRRSVASHVQPVKPKMEPRNQPTMFLFAVYRDNIIYLF
jgi:hypothetical protein